MRPPTTATIREPNQRHRPSRRPRQRYRTVVLPGHGKVFRVSTFTNAFNAPQPPGPHERRYSYFNRGYSPSISKSIAATSSSLTNRFNFAYLMADRESAATTETRDTTRHGADNVTVVQRHQRGFVAVLAVHVVITFSAVTYRLASQVHEVIHAGPSLRRSSNIAFDVVRISTNLHFQFSSTPPLIAYKARFSPLARAPKNRICLPTIIGLTQHAIAKSSLLKSDASGHRSRTEKKCRWRLYGEFWFSGSSSDHRTVYTRLRDVPMVYRVFRKRKPFLVTRVRPSTPIPPIDLVAQIGSPWRTVHHIQEYAGSEPYAVS